MNGLNFQAMEFSFAKGLNQKSDPRLVQAPELVRAVDVDFDNLGGLRLRKPYASIGANIFGGGTISGCRRIYEVGDELILFTQTALYSWSPQRSAWVSKGTHLAAKVDERPVFISTSNQDDCDRAQLSGTVVYCWRQTITGVDEIFVAAQDATTGAVLLTPTDVAPGTRPRVVATATTIILFYESGSGSLVARTVSPTTVAISGTTTVLAAASFNTYYDAEKVPGADTVVVVTRRDTTTAYSLIYVTGALVVTAGTQAFPCDGPIAVACTPDGSSILVARTDGTAIEGELIEVAGGALFDSLSIGSGSVTINQVTAAWVDNTTCRVFWHSNQATNATDFDTDHNSVTIGGSVGTAATLIRRLGIASRAFAYNGEAYVWLAFAGASSFSGAGASAFSAQLQNSYFLYRHDGFLCAKAAWHRAAGFRTTGLLPAAALTSGSTSFSFCGGERRVIPIGETITGTGTVKDGTTLQSTYADTGPRDITVTFDSNDARRVAKLGETVYITGGEVLQYDGRALTEVGFHLYPWYFGSIEVGTGNLADGTYTLKTSWRYDNARGERERSTSATTGQVTIAAGPNGISTTSWVPLYTTHKTGIAAEAWRTPVAGAVFYKTTSGDPTATSNPNRYVENDSTAGTNSTLNDELADADLIKLEPHPENGAELENLAPPAATLIAASETRLFLAGLSDRPNVVVYSKLRNEGSIAAFHDSLFVQVPARGGAITGLAFLNETLVVFRETAIYALDGIGFDNLGGGQNYEPRLVSSTEGAVNQESIAFMPGGLVFKSSKGWYLLNRGWSTQYIGQGVRNYDSETVYSAHVVESEHQVRIVTSGRALVWDYLADAWAEWSITDGLHACVFNGTYHYLATPSVKAQQSDWSTADYAMDVEMLVHLGQMQGFARVQEVMVLGEYRSTHTLRLRAGSYTEGSYFDDKTWTPSPTTVGGALQMRHGPSQQQHQAFRIRLTSSTTAGEKLRLSALSLKVGMKNTTYRNLPAAQKQ